MNLRTLAAATAVATLALPASAYAHGSVFTTIAKVAVPGTPVTTTDQAQYVITNHGFTYVLRESNGQTAGGMVNYKALPSAYRNQAGFTKTRLLAEGDTGAQPHATCRGVAALDAEAATLAWQGADPFYNYVPFQTGSAGLEDDPALWLAVIRDRTGLDLEAAPNAATACAGLGGTYAAADATVTTDTALASGTIEHATGPLKEEITTLRTAAATSEAALRGEITRLMLAATPLKLTLAAPTVSAGQLTSAGTAVKVTGPPLRALSVRLTVSQLKARQLGLKSAVLARQTVTTAADGSAQVQLKATGAAAKAVKALGGPLAVEADAISGDRYATVNGKVTK